MTERVHVARAGAAAVGGGVGNDAAKLARSRTEKILETFHEEASLGKSYDMRHTARLFPFVKPHSKLIVFSLLIGLVVAASQLVRPLIVQHAMDEGIILKQPEILSRAGLAFAALVLVEAVLGFLQTYSMQVGGARAMADLRRYVFAFLHRLPLRFFDQQPVGRLVTRVTNDTDAILELFSSGALSAVTDLVRLAGIVVVMFALDYQLSLIAFAAGPPVLLLVIWVRKRAREAFRQIRAKTARMNATMSEQIQGMTVVQSYGQEDSAAQEFDSINSAYREANMAAIKYDSIQDAAIELVQAACLALIVVSLGYRHTSFGTVFAFAMYLRLFFEPISALAQRYTIMQSAMAGAERVFGLLDVTERDCEVRTPPSEGDPNLAVSMENVSFEYKAGSPVLRGVTFSAKAGERIALVGATGSGKTTISSLLLRLYDINVGKVRIFGHDVASLGRDELRRFFSVVPQDVFLFPGTVAENIAAGQVPDPERVLQVLRRLGAEDLFQARPGGINAAVEERGDNFSAGERQLIAFARALYRDAKILILDEATASVDSDTESRIARALEELMQGRTSIVIAHRLSTVQSADRILVLQKGSIVEQGTHQELLKVGGLYAKLHALHFARTQH